MESIIRWQPGGGMSFIAETGSGHLLPMDGAPDMGGNNLAPRPMEVVLSGTGGCTAFDVVLILQRSRQNILGCEVRLTAERADSDPKVFTRIHFHFVLSGKGIKPSIVERAIKMSAEKYCSASIMLAKTAELTHSWEVIEV